MMKITTPADSAAVRCVQKTMVRSRFIASTRFFPRLDEPQKAVDFLLWDAKNFDFGTSGMTPRVHLDQNVAELLTNAADDGPGYRRAAEAYFPSNGAVLLAVALMVAGGSDVHELNPGFPPNGQWIVCSEGIHPLP